MKTPKHPSTNKVEFDQNSTYRNRLPSLPNTLMASVAILTLSAAFAHAQTNWLVNPGFELGLNGWSIVQPWSWNGPSYAVENTNQFVNGSATVHVSVNGGTNAFKEWGYYQTYRIASGAMQTFPAAPGSVWTADAYGNTQVPDNINANSGTTASSYIQVLFLNAATNYNLPLATYNSPVIDNTSATSTWLHRQVTTDGTPSGNTSLTAPAGTAFVRLQLLFDQPAPVGGVYSGGSCYWDDVKLIRTAASDPEITVQPVPATVVYGQTATFSVVADGLTALSYKWQKDGADITDPNAHGVTTATLTLSNVTTAVQGNYTCTVTDQAGSLTSGQAYLTVNDPGVLSITPPLGQTLTNGATATMSVSAAGSSTLTYGWQANGAGLSGGHYSGINGPTLSVLGVTADDAGTYTVLIDAGAAQASTGLKVVSPAQLATNLLVNPGFEDGVFSVPWETAWTKFNGAQLQTADNYYDPDLLYPVSVWAGTYVSEVYATDADNGFYQNVPVTAGATYHAGGMGYMSQYTPVAGTTFIALQVMFKNAGGGTILTYEAPRFATNGIMTADNWLSMQVTNAAGSPDLVAPDGAVSATVQVYEFNWAYTGGAAYLDNLYLTQVSPPAPPATTITASASGGSIHLTFPTTSGVKYEVLYADGLTGPTTWHTNTTITGDGTVMGASDPIGTGSRFYRLLEHY